MLDIVASKILSFYSATSYGFYLGLLEKVLHTYIEIVNFSMVRFIIVFLKDAFRKQKMKIKARKPKGREPLCIQHSNLPLRSRKKWSFLALFSSFYFE